MRSSRTLALSLTLLAASCAPALADSPGGTNPVPHPNGTTATTANTSSAVIQWLVSLLGL